MQQNTKKSSGHSSKDDALDRKEVEELISACQSPQEKLVIIGLAFTGMRASEFCHLNSKWIRWQEKAIRIPLEEDEWSPKTIKGNRSIPILEPRLEAILSWWFTQHEIIGFDRTTVYRIVKRIAGRTTIKRKVYPHSLRSTYANFLTDKGLSTSSIQHIMGWSKLETADKYIQSSGVRALNEAKEKW